MRVEARRALSFVDHLTLLLIGLVVVLVSLPRLRRFALHENEIDAIRTLRVLGIDAVDHPDALTTGDLGALLAASATHQVRLEDVELLAGGRLRRHGYLFDALRVPSGSWVLRAWPWQHGRTGLGAFALGPGVDLLGTQNTAGRYSGPERPPPAPAQAGAEPWLALRKL